MLNERNTLLEDDGIEEEILVEEECSVAQAVWGDIQGNIENQTDLQNALDAKQDSLTEAQLNAVNSGITAGKVATYDGYADQIASKADQSALNAETIARGEADTALGTRIDNEALARQSADNGLQSQIDAITSKSDVVDVVANYAALQAYDTSTLGNNDVVKVLDDETHEDALTYYRWSTTTQTWTYIGQEAPYYSKGQMDVKLAEKQDKLTAGANIQIQNGTISATDTKYTNGNGLNLNGTEFSADTDVLATKEDLEGYYTKPETDNLLAPKLEAEVVAELPTTGAEGKLYLTPKAHTTSTATGNPIEATITAQAGQLESFQLDGDTFQQTYTGKNLLMNKESAQEKTGITITPNSDGSFTLNGAATVTTDFYFVGSWQNRTISYLDMPSGDYTISLLDSTKQQIASPKFRVELYDRMGEKSSRILWLQQGLASPQTTNVASYAQVTAYYISIQNGTSFSNEKFYIQLETGSTATSFEPFVGGQPSPSPEYPQQIQTVTGEQTVTVVGKNLFDIDQYTKAIQGAGETAVTKPNDNTLRVTNTQAGVYRYSMTPLPDTNAVLGKTITLKVSAKLVNASSGGIRFYWSSDQWYTTALGEWVTFTQDGEYTCTVAVPSDIPSGSTRLCVSLYGSATVSSPAGSYIDYSDIQVEVGSTATTYEPYSSNDYEINLGKNLFDKTAQITNGYSYASDGTLVTVPSCSAQEAYIQVKPNATYTLHTEATSSQTTNFHVYICEYTASKTFIQRDIPNPVTSNTNTITTTANTSYVRLCFSTIGIDTLQFEAGSQATTYAPYFTPIELCKLGTYQDYIWKDGEDWKVHKATIKAELNGTEDWHNSSSAATYPFYVANIFDKIGASVQAANAGEAYFSHFSITGQILGANEYIGACLLVDNPTSLANVRVRLSDMSSGLGSFKTMLSNKKPVIYAKKATATDTTITDTTLIAQLEAIRTALLQNGANTITNTATGSNLAGDMEIGYYGYNPTNRYDKWLWLDINNEYEQIGS